MSTANKLIEQLGKLSNKKVILNQLKFQLYE